MLYTHHRTPRFERLRRRRPRLHRNSPYPQRPGLFPTNSRLDPIARPCRHPTSTGGLTDRAPGIGGGPAFRIVPLSLGHLLFGSAHRVQTQGQTGHHAGCPFDPRCKPDRRFDDAATKTHGHAGAPGNQVALTNYQKNGKWNDV